VEHREALQARYREERDKRVRPDGNAQYRQPSGRFASLLDDPFTPRAERAPRSDDVTVAIIGAGFGGLCTGARLRQAGVDDFLLIDGAGGVGGTWYWNRYPGAMCDTAAMVYLPLLDEVDTVPSKKYIPATEIHAHAQRIATTFGLDDRALLSTEVTALDWDDRRERWIISTDRGDTLSARFVAMGTGPLHRAKLPAIAELDRFGGPMFHTSRWDWELTGGNPTGAPMTGLAGLRVGLVGTGATAVQCVPPLAETAAHLFVFQRTPSSIDVRNNHPIDATWFAELGEGWQRDWLLNFATLQTGGFTDVDLVQDGWTDIAKRIRDRVVTAVTEGAEFTPETVQRAYEDSDDEKMDEIRARVDAIVADPATAEALKPWYRQLCKRPCFHDEYLQAFNRPNVTLVDTDGAGVDRADERGLWVGERHIGLDVVVLASGFEVGTEYARRCGYETTGRDGITLSQRWSDGMVSLHGMHVAGFPNLFILGMSQGANLISNITHNLSEAATTAATIIAAALSTGASTVEVTPEAEAAWIERLESSGRAFLGNPDCTPGYYNNEGGAIGRRERLGASGYPDGPVAFFHYIDAWRRSGEFAGLHFAASAPTDTSGAQR
jgi:cation diffusion facilitator CzcD-associated flavoprotein CzcO